MRAVGGGHLAGLGHDVEIRDAGAEPGGMMRYGIPAYLLPRDVLDAEIGIRAGGLCHRDGPANQGAYAPW